ncbi:S9 family peptidase [Hyphobacterium sp.]|uniref:S9 family peptidase n=1 Tax=Hyphobacterium sp. TaxID=2004662 RepID=UPI003B527696
MRKLIALSVAVGLVAACSPSETTSDAAAGTTDASAAPGAESAGTTANPFATYDAEVFHATTSVGIAGGGSAFAFSQDGTRILVSSDESGVFNAYSIDIETGETTALTTSDTDAYYALTWLPDSDRILVSADQGGNELDHIYVRDESGQLYDITPGDNLKAQFMGWSDDGSQMWVATNERDAAAFDVHAYDTASFEAVVAFENTQGLQIGDMSSDGRYVAMVQNVSSADANIFLVDLQSPDSEPLLITPHEGNIAYGVYGFTPDNTALVYATNEFGEFNQAWTYSMADGTHAPLVEADWDVMYVSHSPSGRYRVVGINEDGRTAVSITDTSSGEPLALPDLPAGDIGSVRFSRDESEIAFIINSSTSPSNVHWVDLETQEHRQLTDTLNPAIDESHLVTATVERFNSFDGLEIPGIIYRPVQASADNPVPALVWVHGGPGGQSRIGYSATIQHLVNHGYAVYAVNNRGSSGYGKTFFHMDDRRHGQEDLGDVVAAGDWLRSLDWVNEDQVGVIGGSYGGYLTAAALAFHPEAFEVGINIFGVTNWVRTLESIPPWWGAFRDALYDEMGDPATDGERHRAISPLFHAGNIIRPMLVVQGANDPRVLQVESDDLVEAIRANGVHVEYVLFPDEGHGFQRKENRITASNAFVTFLDEFLRGNTQDE